MDTYLLTYDTGFSKKITAISLRGAKAQATKLMDANCSCSIYLKLSNGDFYPMSFRRKYNQAWREC